MKRSDNDLRSATSRAVEVGGASIQLREWGSGPAVLFLHGNPDSSVMWDDVAGRLASNFRCCAPDLPGFGLSEIPREYIRSLDGLARFVEQFRVAAEIQPSLDLVAHDFGGPFAFAWAIRNPNAVRRMVAINTVFFSDYRWHFWARIWRTPVLGEASMALMNRLILARELNRGSGRPLAREHIERTSA